MPKFRDIWIALVTPFRSGAGRFRRPSRLGQEAPRGRCERPRGTSGVQRIQPSGNQGSSQYAGGDQERTTSTFAQLHINFDGAAQMSACWLNGLTGPTGHMIYPGVI